MGSRLRNLKQKMKGVKLSDDKALGGTNRLTYKRIDVVFDRREWKDGNVLEINVRYTLFRWWRFQSVPECIRCHRNNYGDDLKMIKKLECVGHVLIGCAQG